MITSEGPDHEVVEHVEGQYTSGQTSQEETLQTVDKSDSPVDPRLAELTAMKTCYAALVVLEENARRRAVTWLIESLEVNGLQTNPTALPHTLVDAANSQGGADGTESMPNPREFISRKKPQSQVERIACLAYYLAHYRNVQHFKASEIADLNIEAAGQKFGNLSRDIDNADRSSGYIVSAGKGAKQLTVRGEAVVDALPNKDAVKLVMQEHPHRAKRSSGSSKKIASSAENDQ